MVGMLAQESLSSPQEKAPGQRSTGANLVRPNALPGRIIRRRRPSCRGLRQLFNCAHREKDPVGMVPQRCESKLPVEFQSFLVLGVSDNGERCNLCRLSERSRQQLT